jgi:hypothetical protein
MPVIDIYPGPPSISMHDNKRIAILDTDTGELIGLSGALRGFPNRLSVNHDSPLR